jgi:hypothetical protein
VASWESLISHVRTDNPAGAAGRNPCVRTLSTGLRMHVAEDSAMPSAV